MEHPRLRDKNRLHADELYPLNTFPDELVYAIGGYIVYLLHTGRTDICGDDWGDAFANAIGGDHFKSPLGIADVAKDKTTGDVKFTWQPHGAQFTIHEAVPTSAVRFRVRKPQVITVADALQTVGYDKSWIEIKR